MKFNPNLSLREMAGEWVLLFLKDDQVDYTRVISLNETSKFLIGDDLSQEFTEEEWVKKLLDNYEVSPEVAQRDVQALIAKLQENNLIQ